MPMRRVICTSGSTGCCGSPGQPAMMCDGSGTCTTPAPMSCATGFCSGTSCLTCGAGLKVCNGICCAAGQDCCGGVCQNLNTPTNCGSCGHNCTLLANVKAGAATCSASGGCVVPAGTSGCNSNFGNCTTVANDTDGCETPTNTNAHCGSCTGCSGATPMCNGTTCICPLPNTICGTSCTNLSTDGANCGACGHNCLGGACAAGLCQPVAVTTNLPSSAVVFGVDATSVYFSAGSPLLSNSAFRVGKTVTAGTPTPIVTGIAASFPGVIGDVMLMRFGGTTPPVLKTCSVSNCAVPATAFMTGDDVIPFRTLVPTVFSTSVTGAAGSGMSGSGTAPLDFNWWGASPPPAAIFHTDVLNETLPLLTMFAGDSRVFWTNTSGTVTSLFVSNMGSTSIFGLARNLVSTPLLSPMGLRIVDANPQSVLLLSSSAVLYRVPMLPFGTNGTADPVQVAAVGGFAAAFAGATEDATRIYWLDGDGTVGTQQGVLASGQTSPGGFYQDATALYWGRGAPNAVMRLAK